MSLLFPCRARPSALILASVVGSLVAVASAVSCAGMVATAASSAEKRKAEGDGDLELAPEPHRDIVYLDRVAESQWIVTNLTTREKASLKGQWELSFDDDSGMGAVSGIDESGQESHALIDDLLHKHLYRSAPGELYIVLETDGGVQHMSLDFQMARYRDASVSLRLGSAAGKTSVAAYIMATPRASQQQVFWGLFDLYAALRLSTFSRQPSKWTHAGLEKWAKWIGRRFPGSHIILSKHWNLGAKKTGSLRWCDRCLPQPSIATVGLLHVLCVWSFLPKQRGGFDGKEERLAAAEVLGALVEAGCSRQGPTVFEVSCSLEWKCSWPRPSVAYGGDEVLARVSFEKPDLVDLSGISELDFDGQAPLEYRRVAAALMKCGVSGRASVWKLPELMLKCFADRMLDALCAQILWAMSRRIQLALADQKEEADIEGRAAFTYNPLAPDPNERDMEEKLHRYVMSGIRESQAHLVFGLATDKAAPAFQTLHNSSVCFPNGVMIMCPPQVDHSFHGNFDDKVGNRKGPGKRENEQSTAELGSGLADAERQKAWMRRASSSDQSSWRPLEVHRVSARRWAYNVDNQIKTSTCRNGLEYLKYDEDEERWASWKSWPGMGVSLDMGSDGVAAFAALTQQYDCNMWMWPGPSHMAQRTFESVLRENKIYDFWCLLLITYNLEHGPHRDQGRRNQLREALSTLLDERSPSQCPLFEQLAPAMARDLEDAGLLQFAADESRDAAVWEYLKRRSRNGPMGRRVSMCRFGGMQHAALHHRPMWHVQLFERLWLALEMDMLRGRKLYERLTIKSKDVEGSEGQSTNPTHLQLDDKALRGVCESAVVVSCLTLDDLHHRRVVDCVLTVQRPLDSWHTSQNRLLRSAANTRTWLLDQICGSYLKNVEAFVGMLSCITSLVDAGFNLPNITPAESSQHTGMDNMELIIEDEYAELYAGMLWSFVTQRVIRGHFYDSWPTKMIGALQSAQDAESIIARFAEDERIYKAFAEEAGKGPIGKAVLKRHVMALRSVKQFSAAFEETGFQLSAGLENVLEQRARTNVATQVIEDFNNAQRGASESKQGRRFRKPSVCMAACLHQDMIAQRHKFSNCVDDAPARSFDSRLPKGAFEPDRKSASFDFHGIASTSATPAWWSPSPANLSLPYADMAMLRSAEELGGSFHVIEQANLAQILTSSHRIAIRINTGESPQWFFCVHAFPRSAALLWPAEFKTLPNGGAYLEAVAPIEGFVLKGIFSLDPEEIEGCLYQWRSWAWQVASVPSAQLASMRPAVRAFMTGHGIRSIQALACLSGSWDCSRATVVEYARHFGIAVDPAASLMDVLWTTVKSSLQCSDEQVLECIHRRVALEAADTEYSEALLEVDGAMDVVDPKDKERVEETQRAASTRLAARKGFREAYAERARKVNSEGDSRKKRRKTASTGVASSAAPARLPIPHHCSQPEAKRLLPPGASVWRSLVRGEWCGHSGKQFKRVTKSFVRYGSSELALRECLRALWSQYLGANGKTTDECTVEGLF